MFEEDNAQESTGQQAEVTNDQGQEVQDQSTQETGEAATQEQIDRWEQDKRYESMWKKDPNEVYKSYRNLEKTFTPLQQKLKTYETKIPEYEKNLQEREAKIAELKQIDDVIKFFDSNPAYQKAILKTLEDVNLEQRKAKFGDLAPDVIARLERTDQLERQFQTIEEERQVEKNLKSIDSQFQEIDKIATQYGIEYDKIEFLDYCKKHNRPVDSMMEIFAKHALPFALNLNTAKTESKVMESIKENRAKAMPTGGNRATRTTLSNEARYLAALKK